MKPKTSTPPSTPRAMSKMDSPAPRAIRMGFTKLSMELITKAPYKAMKIAQPVCPSLYSQAAAPPQINGGPTGIIDRKKVAKPSSTAPGTPAIRKPSRATVP